MSRASHTPHPIDRFVEYFTMRRAESYLRHLGEPRRAELAELLEVARQRAAAAQGLWSVGHTVEAMALSRDALDDTTEVARRLAELERVSPSLVPPPMRDRPSEASIALERSSALPAEGAVVDVGVSGAPLPDWLQVLRANGISDVGLEHARLALETAHRTDFPRLERLVTPQHRAIVHDLLRVRLALDDAVSTSTLAHHEIRGTRAVRRVGVAVVLCLGIAALGWALWPERGAFATASGVWASSSDYGPSRAIDGDEATMWILPDGVPGWLEVRLSPARPVERITLVNAGPPTLRDRGTRRYVVELYAGGALARTLAGELEGAERASATHEVGLEGVERIRFVVESHHGLGGGLAELRWE